MIYDMKIKMKLSRTNFSMNEAKIFDKKLINDSIDLNFLPLKTHEIIGI